MDAWDLPCKSGMVLTVDPGVYFHKENRRVPKKYCGIHVRIEDVVPSPNAAATCSPPACPRASPKSSN
jgi:hypothetical protein